MHTVIFFIFTVANSGGLLAPLGDPPLFLGMLRGVPFTWTFHLIPEWAFVNAMLLLVYFTLDRVMHTRDAPEALDRKSTRLNSSHVAISYAVFCLKKKIKRKKKLQ